MRLIDSICRAIVRRGQPPSAVLTPGLLRMIAGGMGESCDELHASFMEARSTVCTDVQADAAVIDARSRLVSAVIRVTREVDGAKVVFGGRGLTDEAISGMAAAIAAAIIPKDPVAAAPSARTPGNDGCPA